MGRCCSAGATAAAERASAARDHATRTYWTGIAEQWRALAQQAELLSEPIPANQLQAQLRATERQTEEGITYVVSQGESLSYLQAAPLLSDWRHN